MSNAPEKAAPPVEEAGSLEKSRLHRPLLFRRPIRWAKRTIWMAREITFDLGLRDNPSAAVWLRDNPFLVKVLRGEARRPSLFLRLLFTVGILGLILTGGLVLQSHFSFGFWFLRRILPLPVLTLWFAALAFAHTLFVIATRGALAESLATEARRQTLNDLLMTSLRRAEMLLAMAVGPSWGALLAACVGLPVYVFVIELGGATWPEVGTLYLLFVLLSFSPPSYSLPALSGVTPTTPATQLLSASNAATRSDPTAGGRAAWSVLSLFYVFFVMSTLASFFSFLGGGWLVHLSAALPQRVRALEPLFYLTWPYMTTQILLTPLEFFRGMCVPLIYLLPSVLLTWIASALQTAASLSAGSAEDKLRLPIYQRANTLSRWTARFGLLCLAGFVWRAWVLGGDTGYVLGDPTASLAYAAAGLLLMIGAVTIIQGAMRITMIAPYGKIPGVIRSLGHWLRRIVRHGVRPLRVSLLFFALICLLGHLSPFAMPVYHVAGQLLAVGLACFVWTVGFSSLVFLWMSRVSKPSGTLAYGLYSIRLALLLLLPFTALSVPNPTVWRLAALSPAVAWLSLFPKAPALLHAFPYWPLGTLPSFAFSIELPISLGVIATCFGYLRLRRTIMARRELLEPKEANQEAEDTSAEPANKPSADPRTEVILAWIAARCDNPLLLYELRVRTRAMQWLPNLIACLVLIAFVFGISTMYPDVIDHLSFLAALHFFRHDWFAPAGSVSRPQAYADIAALALSGLAYLALLGGLFTGENMIARDLQRGTLGFILITPLTTRQIFWGKVWGQSSGYILSWLFLGLSSLLFSLLGAPAVGLGPALVSWLIGQGFTAALYILCLALGTMLATHILLRKTLRGISLLLAAGVIGLGVWLVFLLFPSGSVRIGSWTEPEGWLLMALRLLVGTLYCLLVSIPAFSYALWRLSVLRHRDIAFGDAVPT